MTPEEIAAELARAELWRAQTARRMAYQSALWASLAAPPGPRAQLEADWRPLEEWLIDRQTPAEDPCDEYRTDPLGMSDTVNVGRVRE